MSDVTRHDFTCFPSGRVIGLDRDEGKYVLHSDYAALLARHNALVEAVKKYFKSERLEILKREARAEVDRLIANEADCKGGTNAQNHRNSLLTPCL